MSGFASRVGVVVKVLCAAVFVGVLIGLVVGVSDRISETLR